MHEKYVTGWVHTFFSGEKFEDFSRIFQDPTLIYMHLPSTKQNVCVESDILGINTCTYKNARQRELKNTCKPDIHCALVGQFHMGESNEKAMGKNECFHTFCKNFENFILCISAAYLNICFHLL